MPRRFAGLERHACRAARPEFGRFSIAFRTRCPIRRSRPALTSRSIPTSVKSAKESLLPGKRDGSTPSGLPNRATGRRLCPDTNTPFLLNVPVRKVLKSNDRLLREQHAMEEVVVSIPTRSTKSFRHRFRVAAGIPSRTAYCSVPVGSEFETLQPTLERSGNCESSTAGKRGDTLVVISS